MVKSKQTAASAGTREILLLTGERLIAINGIGTVSLRQINTAAGQRNSSAAHYHFGSKAALVDAIFDYRMKRVNLSRRLKLASIREQTNDHPNPRQLVETFIAPVVEEIQDTEGGSFYIRFLAQAVGHPHTDTYKFAESRFDAAESAYKQLKQMAPEIPEPIFGQRFGLMWEMIIHTLADWEYTSELQASTQQISRALSVSNLIDSATGALMAPVTASTEAELKRRS
jgi:AcrR family transcriptional regulator